MNLCDKYGGYETFHKAIYELYLELFDNPNISYHFLGVDPFRLSQLQAQFVCRALGGKVKYEGRPLGPVHKSLDISQYQFNEVMKTFEKIFLKHGFTPKDTKHVLKVFHRYGPMVVTCKISWIDRVMIPIYRTWDRIILFFS